MSEVFRLALEHPTGTTRMWAGAGALEAAASEIERWAQGRALFVVTSHEVADFCAKALEAALPRVREAPFLYVPDGEDAKRAGQAERLWQTMLERGGKRDSRVLALGGGSVGDLAGFVAGTFLRGVEFAQLPTTLLAQVDAAIGGKTGIDLPGAKNSVGLFHHPRMVVADTSLLATLPRSELRAGLVEVVKMAALLDPPLLERVEAELDLLLTGDAEALAPIVAAAMVAKTRIVEEDPEEGDRRRLLNFGHTLGHALEAVTGYRDLRHGEAVGYGLLFALRLARRRGLGGELPERLTALLRRFALPPLPALEVSALTQAMTRDKKAREAGLVWVLPQAMGVGICCDDVPMREVEEELRVFLDQPFDPVA